MNDESWDKLKADLTNLRSSSRMKNDESWDKLKADLTNLRSSSRMKNDESWDKLKADLTNLRSRIGPGHVAALLLVAAIALVSGLVQALS